MKRFNGLAFSLSFITVLIACSALSISSVAENHRWTLEAINPLNGLEGIAFVISYLLGSGAFVSYSIAAALFLLIWWGLYGLFVCFIKSVQKSSKE